MPEHPHLDTLCGLLPSQFELLIAELRVPSGILSTATAPIAVRATELLRWVEQQDRVSALDRALQGPRFQRTHRSPGDVDVDACADRWLRSSEVFSPFHVQLDAAEAPPIVVARASSISNHKGPLNLPDVDKAPDASRSRSLEAVAAERAVFVLRGSPGAGKSTACRVLGRRLAAELQKDAAGSPVPVLIELRHYTRRSGETALDGLERLISRGARDGDLFSPDHVESAEHGRRILVEGLAGRPVTLYFDGLNEVGAAFTKDAHDAVKQVIDRLRDTKMRAIVTTRRHGAEVSALGDVDVFDVQPLSGDEIQTYLARRLGWTKEHVARVYEHELGARVQLVASNPLALNLLCGALQAGGDAPQSRGELFRTYVNGTLRRDQKDKLGEAPLNRFEPPIKRRVLEELAYAMHLSGRSVPIAEAVATLQPVLAADAHDPREVLDELCRNGLLTRDDESISFAHHHTFQEYFCAAALLARYRKGQLETERIAADPRWWEPFGMVGGMVKDDKELGRLLDQLSAHPPLAGMLLGNARPGSNAERDFVAGARRTLDAGIHRAVVWTHALLWVLLLFVVALWRGAGRLSGPLARAMRALGVDPLDGLPLKWVVVVCLLVAIAGVSQKDLIEAWLVRFHDRTLRSAYDRWVEPWLLALYYTNSLDAERALQSAYAAHGSRRAVDQRIRRYLESFTVRSLCEDPELLCEWLDDPTRRELAVIQLGAAYQEHIATLLINRLLKRGASSGIEIDVFAEWLTRRPEARSRISEQLAAVARNREVKLPIRRFLTRLLRDHGQSAPPVPLTFADISGLLNLPVELVFRPLMTILILPAALLTRLPRVGKSPAGARARHWLRTWCHLSAIRPGVTALEMIIDASIQAKEVEPAEELLRYALASYPYHSGLLQSRGDLLHNLRRQYARAAEAYAEALLHAPDSPGNFRSRSRSLRAAGKHEEALRTARRATELDGDNADSWDVLVTALIAAKKSDEAGQVLEEALTRYPRHWGLLVSRGNLLHYLGKQYLPASAAYAKALLLDPDSPFILRLRSTSLSRAGKHDEAIRSARRANELEGDNPGGWQVLLDALIAAKKGNEAEQVLEEALTRYPGHVNLLISRGNLLHNVRRQYALAAEAYAEVLRIEPDSSNALRNRINSCRLAGQIEEAARDADKLQLCDPDSPDTHLSIAALLMDQGAFDEAAKALERVVGDPVCDLWRWICEAEIQLARGMLDEASATIDRMSAPGLAESSLNALEDLLLLRAEIALRRGRFSEARIALQKIDASPFSMWVAFLAHLGAARVTGRSRKNPLIARHLRLQALRRGVLSERQQMLELPEAGIFRIARQSGLMMDAEIARLEGRPAGEVAELQVRADRLSMIDRLRLEPLLRERDSAASPREAEG